MDTKFSCGRKAKEAVLSTLKGDNPFREFSTLLESFSAQQLVCPLFSGVLQPDQYVRWHAVTAFGLLLPALWDESPERARVLLRRFIWNLNEESGGIGWGMPEAMAESIGAVSELAAEFTNVFLSYIHEKEGPDNFLDHAPLRRGALWGVARLAQLRPDLAQNACPDLLHHLATEQDPECLGLVCLALSLLPTCTLTSAEVQHLNRLSDTTASFTLYWNRSLHTVTVGQLARQAEPTP
ncbi:MAG: HEAT repeat domain-containing protein [Desulfohalobium sp.]